ncbi:voltage-dependent T-type calcium channel subunit alpha-1H-like isoform X1 [Lates japonicus]|uniref:Voltage-dependent T-type calcium channel subunit alpha-1H-like isoform X1 n=1 Tax=Lates japonicus TaxID=270547 RepID=A0AAD3R9R8_LATJO|nr:voltage-dependent T-type calcium channel subunit alpha-1H-like isoform X1 [Lates japonicus]
MADAIPINPSILRVCRVLRLAQVLKAKKIRVLLKTIIKTLTQVGNICLLFTFFFFIYAALGVELFGKLECTIDHLCMGLHRHANFKHFGMALLTLYQVCTGDNWNGIMKDTLRECRPDDDGCLRYLSWASPIFFTSFVIMAQFVLVNLVVAAIMQALEDSHENNPTNFCLPPEEENMQDTEQELQCAGDRSNSSHIYADRSSECSDSSNEREFTTHLQATNQLQTSFSFVSTEPAVLNTSKPWPVTSTTTNQLIESNKDSGLLSPPYSPCGVRADNSSSSPGSAAFDNTTYSGLRLSAVSEETKLNGKMEESCISTGSLSFPPVDGDYQAF